MELGFVSQWVGCKVCDLSPELRALGPDQRLLPGIGTKGWLYNIFFLHDVSFKGPISGLHTSLSLNNLPWDLAFLNDFFS